jgi:hypothetical protein
MDQAGTGNFNRVGALLSSIMLAAIVAVLAGAIRRFTPAWQPYPFVAVMFVVALEASIMHYAGRSQRMALGETIRYLVPEFVVLVVVMRFVTTLSAPHPSLGQILSGWLYDPLSVLDPVFVVQVLAGVLIAFVAHRTMRDLAELSPSSAETLAPREEGHERAVVLAAAERTAALRRIGGRFAVGGALLLALSLEAVSLERIGGLPNPLSTVSVAAALAYVVSGFTLYSRARLAVLQTRWQVEGAQIAPGVQRSWSRGSALLIGGVIALAALLPRSYGMGLIDALRTVLAAIGYALAIAGYLITYLFGMALMLPAWLLSLLLPNDTPGSISAPPPPQLPPPPAVVEHEPPLLPALIFWLCVMLLAGRAIWIVLQRHPGVLRGVRAWLAVLREFLSELWRDTRVWAAYAASQARSNLGRAPRPQPQREPRPRLSRLSPRELIAYYYRATLQRAAQRGVRRRPGQTPSEYQATLTARLPEASEDVGQLTDMFVRARYAPRPISPDDTRLSRTAFERIRNALRRHGPPR